MKQFRQVSSCSYIVKQFLLIIKLIWLKDEAQAQTERDWKDKIWAEIEHVFSCTSSNLNFFPFNIITTHNLRARSTTINNGESTFIPQIIVLKRWMTP